jgi:hypothetical protein
LSGKARTSSMKPHNSRSCEHKKIIAITGRKTYTRSGMTKDEHHNLQRSQTHTVSDRGTIQTSNR